MLLRNRCLILVALGILTQAGCVPTVWLPDSSGFVYVKPVKGGHLVHFDIKSKKERVIVENIGRKTWPAISPDGKRIAVAGGFRHGPKLGTTLQFVIYDFQGKTVHRSKEFDWTKEEVYERTMLFWSPKGDMLVVTGGPTAIYNLEADTLKAVQGYPVILGGTPIRPDGSGFLVADLDSNSVGFVDWTGKRQAIAGHFEFIWAMHAQSWWEGNVAVGGFKNAKKTYSVDTVKHKIEFPDSLAESFKHGKSPTPRYDFPGDLSVVLTLGEPAGGFIGPGPRPCKVAIVNNKTNKEETILEKGPESCLFLPSPDGNYVTVCLSDPLTMDPNGWILVISAEGEVVAKMHFPDTEL
jgi:hypothetical protein